MCEIISVQIVGSNFDSNGAPTSYELDFRIKDCERVDVTVSDTAGSTPVFQGAGLIVNGPDDSHGFKLMVLPFTPKPQGKPCGGRYHVVVTCRSGACRFDDDVVVVCKEGEPTPTPQPCSPTALVVVRNSAGTEVNLGQACLPEDVYTIEIVSPWSANATAQWFVATAPTSGGASVTSIIAGATGRQLPYPLPDSLQPPGTARTVFATISSQTEAGQPCTSGAAAILPPVHPGKCPTTITLELRLNGQLKTPDAPNTLSYSNLAAGHYELRVADPVGSAITYDWFSGGTTPTQSGASNVFTFDLAASNSPREIEVFVRVSDCCPVLRGSVTLSVGTIATPIDPGSNTGTTPTPVTPPPPSPICGLIRMLLALALLVLFVSLMFTICPSPITPGAIVAGAAALAAFVILLALAFFMCGIDFCGFWRTVIWALRWAIVLGIIGALVMTFTAVILLSTLVCVLLAALGYGVICGMLIVWISGRGCAIPTGFSWP